METSTKPRYPLLVLLVLLVCAFYLSKSVSATTLDEWINSTSIKLPLDHCHKMCDTPFYETGFLETCSEECQRLLTKDAALECQVLKLYPKEDSKESPELAICSTTKCITIPFGDYFPSQISGMNLYHYRDLIGYCIRAGVKSRMFYNDRGTTIHADLIDIAFDSKSDTSIYNLDSNLLPSSSVISGVAADSIKSHPVLISSVARLFREYDNKYRKYRAIIENLLNNPRHFPVIDHDSFDAHYLKQLEIEQSKKNVVNYVLDGVSSFFYSSSAEQHLVYDIDSFSGCYINLVSSGHDSNPVWTITTPEHPETFGHVLSSTLSPYTIPTVVYSTEYLKDLCSLVRRKYDSDSQHFVISMDLALYHYDRISLPIPYLFPLFKASSSSKVIYYIPIFI